MSVIKQYACLNSIMSTLTLVCLNPENNKSTRILSHFLMKENWNIKNIPIENWDYSSGLEAFPKLMDLY